MHKIAEYGIASHWSYKLHGSVETVRDSMETKLQIFRSIMELNEESDTLICMEYTEIV
jgi:GTP pyrophosphokinase